MSEGQSSRTHTAPGEGESVWLVGDLIEVRLSAEDTGGAYSMIEETTPPAAARPRTCTPTRTRRSACLRGRSSSCSARAPSPRA